MNPTLSTLFRVVAPPRLRSGERSENLQVGDVVRVIGVDEDGDLVVEREGWNDHLSVAPECISPTGRTGDEQAS